MYSQKINIAGPCSAESYEQLFSLAEAIKVSKLPIHYFRAGVWKPRSRPGGFEGYGENALKWLQSIQDKLEIKIIIEVAHPKHIELAQKYEIENYWIGARTAADPFSVQTIADCLSGNKGIIFVKNAIHPDLNLWIGNVERIQKQNLGIVGAIHRGFASYNPSEKYRNTPNWALPLDFKRLKPEIPILCDPSHIAGKSELVFEVGQKAWNLNFDGIMVETHPCPEVALSDALQQITPKQLVEFFENWKISAVENISLDKNSQLEHLRQIIDTLDSEIIDLLGERLEIASEIGSVKSALNIPAYLPERWKEIIKSRSKWAEKHHISEETITEIYSIIHQLSIKVQMQKMNEIMRK